ncbi:unnamed protein product, partial [Schistosoma curassoni]|uniref:Pecanex-like protein n=1 Tax=Schistosoma curassoni TaxID=6186 RepID=A0A183JTM6_9TREM
KSATKFRSTQSSSSSISSFPTNSTNNHVYDVHNMNDNINSIDPLCFTQSLPGVNSSSYKPYSYEGFIQHHRQMKVLLMNKRQGNLSENFQTAIIHALSLILMGQVCFYV